MGTIDDYLAGLDATDAAVIAHTYDVALEVAPEAVATLLATLREDADWVVADLPHGLDAMARRLLRTADRVVLVAPPNLAGRFSTALPARARRRWCCAARVRGSMVAPARGKMTACTRSPHFSSGTPTTAHSSTSGW